ncbi:MAG: hypothetical protein M3460_16185 [Actinomycetota bacterium]|nr:hypothetical protein [Actinomycetota bacterium]
MVKIGHRDPSLNGARGACGADHGDVLSPGADRNDNPIDAAHYLASALCDHGIRVSLGGQVVVTDAKLVQHGPRNVQSCV